MTQQGLAGGTMGSLAAYANNLAPGAGAAMTNTTAALGTGLGGQFTTTATLTASTDGIVCSYQNPAGSVNQRPRTLMITGVRVQSLITAALTGGPLYWLYSLAFGHTAVSMATAESTSFANATAKAPRRVPLGIETIVVTAPVGYARRRASRSSSTRPSRSTRGSSSRSAQRTSAQSTSAGDQHVPGLLRLLLDLAPQAMSLLLALQGGGSVTGTIAQSLGGLRAGSDRQRSLLRLGVAERSALCARSRLARRSSAEVSRRVLELCGRSHPAPRSSPEVQRSSLGPATGGHGQRSVLGQRVAAAGRSAAGSDRRRGVFGRRGAESRSAATVGLRRARLLGLGRAEPRGLRQSASGSEVFQGDASQQLGRLRQWADGDIGAYYDGVIVQSLGALQQSATGGSYAPSPPAPPAPPESSPPPLVVRRRSSISSGGGGGGG